jgi:uncharacterized RDD family membrane protein YckC
MRNPASDLWFISPAGMRLCASLPAEAIDSVAAADGELWCLAQGSGEHAWRLVGEDWLRVPLPAESLPASRRALAWSRGSLWMLALLPDGRSLRWVRDADAWRPVEIETPPWESVIAGSDLLALRVRDGRFGSVHSGRWVQTGTAVADAALLGWGEDFVALTLRDGVADWSICRLGEGAFAPPQRLPTQVSTAPRWFHLPLLGVASLGALMCAAIAKAARGVREQPAARVPEPMAIGRRVAALVIDAAPVALATMLALDAGLESLAMAPLWATDRQEAMVFVWVAVGTAFFGALEESAGARSMGKRLMGGRVTRPDGSPAGIWRHVLRNLLKALVVLSPILALPALVNRRGMGVAETISGTAVIEG